MAATYVCDILWIAFLVIWLIWAIWIECLAVAITAAGLGFSVWARAYIRRNWSSSVTVKVGQVKSRIEEHLMVGVFGAEYSAYS